MRRLAAGLLLVLGMACGSDTPQATRAPVVSSTANELPRGFPPEFPLPGDWKVVYSTAEADGLSAFFSTQEPREKVRELMIRELPQQGWAFVSCNESQGADGPQSTILATNSGVLASIVIGPFPKGYPPGGSDLIVKDPFTFVVTMSRMGAAPPPAAGGCT